VIHKSVPHYYRFLILRKAGLPMSVAHRQATFWKDSRVMALLKAHGSMFFRSRKTNREAQGKMVRANE